MAYAAVATLAQTLNQISQEDHYRSLLDGKQTDTLQFIHENTTSLQSFLEDLPKKQSDLEARVRDAAYQAEDIVENFILDKVRGNLEYEEYWKQGRENRGQNYQDLEQVASKIAYVLKEVKQIKTNPRNEDTIQPKIGESSSSRFGGYSKNNENIVVGFEDQLMAMRTRLCGESSKRRVIPLVGMGGIGKTTLARYLYNDQLIVEYFPIRAWATISQTYSVQEIFLDLLSIKGPSEDSVDSLLERLYKSLKGRRYLIVLDDMWDGLGWDVVNRAFPDDNNGSRIILTTRSAEVAAHVDSLAPLHEMNFLDDSQSWDLLRNKIFGKECCPLELEEIGKFISRNCKGLPLAIVIISGLLTAEKTLDHWNNIARRVITAVCITGDEFFELLSLSYDHLPQHLKSCFLFMGGFPEDHKISVSRLVKLWVGEGFLKPIEGKSPEKVGEECLDNLVKRSLVTVVSRKSNGKIKYCSIHDTLRELSLRKAQEEHFLENARGNFLCGTMNTRRISVHAHGSISLTNVSGAYIRTVLLFHHDDRLITRSLKTLKLLRIFEALNLQFELFPDEIIELLHLTYLAFNFGGYKREFRIPASIARLWNLQTLIIGSFGRSITIKVTALIWTMPKLRHLVFPESCVLPQPYAGLPTLQNLQSLFLVASFTFTKEIVHMMPNLKKLGISYHGNISNRQWEDYQLKNLADMHQLENLHFCGRGGSFPDPTFFLENIAFPETLRQLTLTACRLPWKSLSMVAGSLPHLKVLKLKDEAFQGDEWETSEGDFSRLKVLQLNWMWSLRHWITESTHFPRLEQLKIYSCRSLEEIPDCIGDIPTLQLIELDGCRKSVLDSARGIQTEQEGYGNEPSLVRATRILE